MPACSIGFFTSQQQRFLSGPSVKLDRLKLGGLKSKVFATPSRNIASLMEVVEEVICWYRISSSISVSSDNSSAGGGLGKC